MLPLYMESSFFGSYMDITEYLLLTLLPSDMMYPSSSNFFFVVVHATFLPYLSFACSIAHNLSLSLLKRGFSIYSSGTSKDSLSNKYNKSKSLKKSHRFAQPHRRLLRSHAGTFKSRSTFTRSFSQEA